ncbi:MAG: D-glycerate dehydrogenase [Calothrix sp. MO_192.B10]|nr:D-glycerate dehydrogenase [Calothrix sp. MO_192.B10]
MNSKQAKVFITRRLPVELAKLEQIAKIEIWEERQPPPEQILLEKARSANGIICLLTDPIDKRLIESATDLKVISQMAVGYDNIDIATATAKMIPVGHTPGVLTDTTADFTWALLMTAARRLLEADRFTRSGLWKTWEPDLLLGASITGATLGIIGFGRIGQAIARRAQGFDMRILYTGKNRSDLHLENTLGVDFVSLERLLEESDFVTIHTPLSRDTYHLLSDRQFELMKPDAILINTARGAVVDPKALYRALSKGQIAGAALDVTEPEPLPSDSPLLTLDNLIITPHIASASRQTREKMANMAIENLIAGLNGDRLPYCVNPEVYH